MSHLSSSLSHLLQVDSFVRIKSDLALTVLLPGAAGAAVLGQERRTSSDPVLSSSSPQAEYMAQDTSDVGSKVVNVFFYHSDTMPVF